jgi:hypothetical protein
MSGIGGLSAAFGLKDVPGWRPQIRRSKVEPSFEHYARRLMGLQQIKAST